MNQLGIDGQVQPERVCACGCGSSLDGMRRDARWLNRAHAVRWARANPGKSLNDALSANKARTRRRGGPSGLQVSYPKAVKSMTGRLVALALAGDDLLDEYTIDRCGEIAEEGLRLALSDRQRALLKGRDAA